MDKIKRGQLTNFFEGCTLLSGNNVSMKKLFSILLLTSSVLSYGQEKPSTGTGLLKKAGSALGKAKGGGTSLSNDEIIAGLKEALSVGAKNSSNKLSAADGFFANAAIKVLMPAEAKKVETTLRSAGMGQMVDDAILSMNRAAEEASKSSAPIFIDAIKQMGVQDALGILRGADTAATSYLKGKTLGALTSSFRPVIDDALQKQVLQNIGKLYLKRTINYRPHLRKSIPIYPVM